MLDLDLSGRTALVTGASSGIGRGVARRFAEAGADVAVNHPPAPGEREGARETADAVEGAGSEALVVEADVADADAVEAMLETVHGRWGPLDVLVNNAGVADRCRLAEMPVEAWDAVVDVNLRGTFLCTRFALPTMLEAGAGAVVNVASNYGIDGAAEMVHYSASKGGVVAFTRALAREVSPAVRINAIAPGPIETGIRGGVDDAWREWRSERVPMGRIGDVDDVAATALFLASDLADYYTGQVLSPDGGETMH